MQWKMNQNQLVINLEHYLKVWKKSNNKKFSQLKSIKAMINLMNQFNLYRIKNIKVSFRRISKGFWKMEEGLRASRIFIRLFHPKLVPHQMMYEGQDHWTQVNQIHVQIHFQWIILHYWTLTIRPSDKKQWVHLPILWTNMIDIKLFYL